MTKQEAIEKYRSIQGGGGVNRQDYLVTFDAGEIAKGRWNEPDFTLGVEYGYLIALAEMFSIAPDDLKVKIKADAN